jgi:hypothetical protein
MIFSAQQILRKCKYYIEYNWDNSSYLANIHVTWDDNNFLICYDTKKESIRTNYNNIEIKCPEYAAPAAANMILRLICEDYRYPFQWLMYHVDSNPTTTFFFDMLEDEEDKAKASFVYELMETLLSSGLKQEHILIAQELGIWDGFKAICDHHLGVTIHAINSD